MSVDVREAQRNAVAEFLDDATEQNSGVVRVTMNVHGIDPSWLFGAMKDGVVSEIKRVPDGDESYLVGKAVVGGAEITLFTDRA